MVPVVPVGFPVGLLGDSLVGNAVGSSVTAAADATIAVAKKKQHDDRVATAMVASAMGWARWQGYTYGRGDDCAKRARRSDIAIGAPTISQPQRKS